MTPEHAHS